MQMAPLHTGLPVVVRETFGFPSVSVSESLSALLKKKPRSDPSGVYLKIDTHYRLPRLDALSGFSLTAFAAIVVVT